MPKPECPPVRFGHDNCGFNTSSVRRTTGVSKPPQRFTQEEWALANTLAHQAAECEQEASERLQAEALRIVDESREITLRAQQDVDWKFKQRIRDMEHWRDELTLKYEGLYSEIDSMLIYNQRIATAVDAVCSIMKIDKEILRVRDCRLSIDLVHDEPQKQVLHEIKIVEGIHSVLMRSLQLCTEQLRLVRKAAYNLGQELSDKNYALDVDNRALNLDEHRPEVQRQCNLCDTQYSDITEAEWKATTERNKTAAEKVVNASIQLRTNTDSLLRQFSEDLKSAVCTTDRTFELRLKEVINAKSLLEEQHSAISIKVREMEGTVCKLKKAFEERQGAIALAETRLNLRGRRPNSELILDPVHRRLIREIEENNRSMAKINENLILGNKFLRSLLVGQLDLEDAINTKASTIAVDETIIMPMRKSIFIPNC